MDEQKRKEKQEQKPAPSIEERVKALEEVARIMTERLLALERAPNAGAVDPKPKHEYKL